MKVNEFVEGFNKTRDKVKFCKEHIVNTYLPYERKQVLCENIINSSMYREVNGKKMFYVDSVIKYELYVLTIIREYTDIEMSTDGTEMLSEFNALEEANATISLVEAIGIDAKSFDQVLQMMVDDAFSNNSLEAKLETKFEALELVLKALGDISENQSLTDEIK